MAPRAGGHGRGNATACPFLETSASQGSLALQALWGHGKHPSPTGESAKHQVTKCLGDCKAPGCGALVLSPTAGVWKPGLWARCEVSGEVSAPRGTEGFLLPARIRFGRSWERSLLPTRGESAVSGWPRGTAPSLPGRGWSGDLCPTGKAHPGSAAPASPPAHLRLLLCALRQRRLRHGNCQEASASEHFAAKCSATLKHS